MSTLAPPEAPATPSDWFAKLELSKSTNFVLAVVILATVVGLFLRLKDVDRYSLSLDEPTSVFVAHGLRDPALRQAYPTVPWIDGNIASSQDTFDQEFYAHRHTLSNVVKASVQQDGGNGIAFSLCLFAWTKLIGSHDIIVKLLSVLFGVACIPITFFAAKEITRSRLIGVTAALLTACHPALIMISQTVRPYSMATFFCLASTYLLFRILNNRTTRATSAFYWLTLSLCLLSHYLTIYVVCTHFVLALLRIRSVRCAKSFAIPFLLGGASCAGWLVFRGLKAQAVMQAQNQRLLSLMNTPAYAWVTPVTWNSLQYGWWAQTCFVIGTISGYPTQAIHIELMLIAAAIVLASALCFLGSREAAKDYGLVICSLLALTFAAPVFSTVLSFKAGHTVAFCERYATFSIPFFNMLLATIVCTLLTERGKLLIRTSCIALAVALLLGLGNNLLFGARVVYEMPYAQNRYLALSKLIQLQYKPGMVVAYPTWLSAAYTNVYLRDKTPIKQRVDEDLNQKVMLQTGDGKDLQVLMDFNVSRSVW